MLWVPCLAESSHSLMQLVQTGSQAASTHLSSPQCLLQLLSAQLCRPQTAGLAALPPQLRCLLRIAAGPLHLSRCCGCCVLCCSKNSMGEFGKQGSAGSPSTQQRTHLVLTRLVLAFSLPVIDMAADLAFQL